MGTKTLLCCLGLSLLLTACEAGRAVPMPQDLIGIWRTQAEPYADRYLELTPLEVRFGTGEESSSVHPVSEVRELEAPPEAAYRISYLSEAGQEYWLSVQYLSSARELRLVNQPHLIWTRTLVLD